MRVQLAAVLCISAATFAAGAAQASEPAKSPASKLTEQRRGFYLHACWKFNYPFAVRAWQRADYDNMFQLLRHLGFNTVMLWPCLEAVPAPLSQADRQDMEAYRAIIADAQKRGLETWLTQCVVTSTAEIAEKPWMQRSLYAHMKTVRMDNPQESAAYLEHRAAMMAILNNADGYVTIDGDPGSYPNAKAPEFLKVLLHDRTTVNRVGTHPKSQKIIPWIWAGWGNRGLWQDPVEPHVTPTLNAIKRQQESLAPWELLPGRSTREGCANGRINVELAKKAGLLDRATLFCYEAIEFEPTPPTAWLQLADIRRIVKQEMVLSPGNRGWFGNAQQPLTVLPNIYLFARGTADPSYLDRPDEKVLADLAGLLGGPPELLVPAWACTQLKLDKLPPDLPARLRAATLSGKAAAFLPGGSQRYLAILAAQADSRIRLLQACRQPAKTPAEAAAAIAAATAALVDWWNLHRWVADGEGSEAFQWRFVHGSQFGELKAWCDKNVTDPKKVYDVAVQKIIERNALGGQVAKDRVRELLAR
jgi:hypothetical protein